MGQKKTTKKKKTTKTVELEKSKVMRNLFSLSEQEPSKQWMKPKEAPRERNMMSSEDLFTMWLWKDLQSSHPIY